MAISKREFFIICIILGIGCCFSLVLKAQQNTVTIEEDSGLILSTQDNCNILGEVESEWWFWIEKEGSPTIKLSQDGLYDLIDHFVKEYKAQFEFDPTAEMTDTDSQQAWIYIEPKISQAHSYVQNPCLQIEKDELNHELENFWSHRPFWCGEAKYILHEGDIDYFIDWLYKNGFAVMKQKGKE